MVIMKEISLTELELTRRDFQAEDRESIINIAVPHIRILYKSRRANLNKVLDLIKQAKEESNIHIFLVPSGFLYGPLTERYEYSSQSAIKRFSERIPGDITNVLEDLAKKYGVYIITGSLLEKAGPRIFATSVVVSPFQEGVMYKYRKMTLSENETARLAPGKEPGLIEIGGLRIGILLEEDMFMPEISRVLALSRVDLFISFSKLTDRFSMIKYLVISRAIENLTPVINVGGVFSINDEDIVNIKTLIVRGNGVIEGESKDEGEEIFYTTIKIKDPKKKISKRTTSDVMRNLVRYMRRNKLL